MDSALCNIQLHGLSNVCGHRFCGVQNNESAPLKEQIVVNVLKKSAGIEIISVDAAHRRCNPFSALDNEILFQMMLGTTRVTSRQENTETLGVRPIQIQSSGCCSWPQ